MEGLTERTFSRMIMEEDSRVDDYYTITGNVYQSPFVAVINNTAKSSF